MIPMYNVPTDKKDIWNPSFYKDFLGYESVIPWWHPLEPQYPNEWPNIDDYNSWFNQSAKVNQLPADFHVSFIPQSALTRYEQDVYLRRTVCTRKENWHDFFNNMTWILYPKTKWALIQRSYHENADKLPTQTRTKRQNLLAHFDECGMILCSDQPELFNDVKTHAWKKLFVQTRDLKTHAWPLIFGHGLFEKAKNPYIGMTAKSVFLEVPSAFFDLPMLARISYIDTQIAEWILSVDFPNEPKALHPFPMLGWPDWHAQNKDPAFYDNRHYFRPMPLPASR